MKKRREIRQSRQKLYEAVRLLRRVALPANGYRVHVRVVPVPADRLGDCSACDKRRRFLIRLSKDLIDNYPDAMPLLLAHEWAHTLSWGERADHGKRWGVAFAYVWRLLVEEQ
jgi:hypothetical protein